jgi:hypothetical protein
MQGVSALYLQSISVTVAAACKEDSEFPAEFYF